MNNRGNITIYGIMLGLVIIILALALAPAGSEFITDARNVSSANSVGMDCSNSSISNFDKGACVVTDFSLVWFFGGLVFIGGGVIVSKILFT